MIPLSRQHRSSLAGMPNRPHHCQAAGQEVFINRGRRIYAETHYYHAFLLMLVFAVIAVLGSFRLRETFCRNISVQLKVRFE